MTTWALYVLDLNKRTPCIQPNSVQLAELKTKKQKTAKIILKHGQRGQSALKPDTPQIPEMLSILSNQDSRRT